MALTSVLLVRWAGGYRWVSNGTLTYGRREGFLSMGYASSDAEVDAVGSAILALQELPQVATVAGVEPAGGDEPYVDFGVADWIDVPDEDGTPVSMRVMALTVTEDAEGEPIFAPELRHIADDKERQLQRWLKRLANGSLGGTTESATPLQSSTQTTPPVSSTTGGGGSGWPPFHEYEVAVGILAGRHYPTVTETRTRLWVSLADPGTGDTEVQLLHNGVAVSGVVTLNAGTPAAGVDFTATFTGPETDYAELEVLAAGTNAFGLTAQVR